MVQTTKAKRRLKPVSHFLTANQTDSSGSEWIIICFDGLSPSFNINFRNKG